MNLTSTDRWITMEEACNYLGVTRPTILEWIKAKGFPAAKAGRSWRFKTQEIDEWMRKNANRECE